MNSFFFPVIFFLDRYMAKNDELIFLPQENPEEIMSYIQRQDMALGKYAHYSLERNGLVYSTRWGNR